MSGQDDVGATTQTTASSRGKENSDRTLQEQLNSLAPRGDQAICELVDAVIGAGVERDASDIHLEPTPEAMMVRMRLDGVMQDVATIPEELAPNIVARCKVMGGLLTYRCNVPQEGSASGADYASDLDLRISTYPTLHGERVAIRLFDANPRLETLDGLGLSNRIEERISGALSSPQGMILLSGPSGSGKTTTLYACLNYIQDQSAGGRHIVTVEDPIENEISGVTQTAVNEGAGLTFASGLRSLLRQDPEVIMVGEIRDAETAHIAVEAALTGHLVLSTVHAPRASLVPHRLLDMGVETYTLASSLKLVLSQRLVRRLCSECKGPLSQDKESLPPDVRDSAMTATGCSDCQHTGYDGRILLAEMMEYSQSLHDAIIDRASREKFLQLTNQDNDLTSMAWRLVSEGKTSAFEVQRVLGEDNHEI